MFIERRKRGKTTKYYLVHPVREGKKVIKLSRYLGQNLSEGELKKKRKKAEAAIKEQLKLYKEIRDPLKTVLSEQEIAQLERLERKIGFRVHHLSKKQWLRFTELFSYNTNAIEGSTLTFKEVRDLLEGVRIPPKSEDDLDEAHGVAKAIGYIRETKTHISLTLLRKLHHIVFEETKDFAGQFRKKGVEVVIADRFGNIIHRGAPSHRVEKLLQELVDWYGKNKKRYPAILLAAVVHNQFENIHPFQDGNGRVGRLLLNNILLKHGMPPVDIEFVNRQEYYLALQAYQNEGKIRPMLDLLIKEFWKLKRELRG